MITLQSDFLTPKKEGLINDDHIQGELGSVLSGKIAGRNNPDEITLFKALGIGIEDLTATNYVYEKSKENGAGKIVSL